MIPVYLFILVPPGADRRIHIAADQIDHHAMHLPAHILKADTVLACIDDIALHAADKKRADLLRRVCRSEPVGVGTHEIRCPVDHKPVVRRHQNRIAFHGNI